MELEIEKKAWIKDIDALEEKLKGFASFKKTEEKNDTYYYRKDEKQPIDFKNDRIFRIRQTKKGSFITYKKREFSGSTEVNIENEFEIINPDRFEGFIDYIGYELLVKKT